MNGHAPASYDNMTSYVEAEEKRQQTNCFKPETASFTITPPNTTLKIQRSANYSLH